MAKKRQRPTAEKRQAPGGRVVERVQTGVRVEKRLLKVLKGLAEYHDITLGDLLEGIVLHAFDGKSPFGKPSLEVIARLKKIYALDSFEGLLVDFAHPAHAIQSVLIIVFLIFEPLGLYGIWVKIRNYWKRWPFSY